MARPCKIAHKSKGAGVGAGTGSVGDRGGEGGVGWAVGISGGSDCREVACATWLWASRRHLCALIVFPPR
eukprot:5484964-Lingulodinium_polyedra.AAC.1